MEPIKEILELLNPWWKTSNVSFELAKPYKRKLFEKIIELKKYKQIIVLSGLRRVGKSTLLYQTIENLLKNNNSKNILYFSFDKKVEDITTILNSYQELTLTDWKKERIFVFFDEITKLGNWADKLKLVYDAFPNLKFFVSSSGSLALEEEAIKNLAGRYFVLNLKPLSFQEYLELKEKQELIKNPDLYEKELKQESEKYFLRSFPEIINWEDMLLIKDYLRSMIIDKIIKYDLEEKFKNINRELLKNLLEIFYNEPGMYIDYDSLSKKLRISKKTLIKHIYYLEFSYLIKKVRNLRPSTLTSLKKLQRIYSYWWTLAYCYSDDKDKIMENIIASTIDIKNYWRKNGKEIDFIFLKNKEIIPAEIKNKTEISKEDIKTLIYFLKKFKLKEGIIIYNGKSDEILLENKIKIKLIPLWKWLLQQ